MIHSSLVSIIIPTYNRANKILDAIESALNQTYKNTQIIVIDDGSTDETVTLLKKYPQVEYHYKKNGGQASARNFGLKYAKGNIIASLDSDDIWYPSFLERCVTKLETDQLDFVFANWEQDDKFGCWNFLINDPFLAPYNKRVNQGWVNLNNEELRDLYVRACPSPSSSVVLKKSSIVSGWDEKMNIGDDWCMYLEMILSKKVNAAYTLDCLWSKRVDEINVFDGRKWSEVLQLLYIEDIAEKMKKFSGVLRDNELRILQKKYMESLVELSKHKLIREKDFIQAIKLLKKSMVIDIPFTLINIPIIYFNALERKFKEKMKRNSNNNN